MSLARALKHCRLNQFCIVPMLIDLRRVTIPKLMLRMCWSVPKNSLKTGCKFLTYVEEQRNALGSRGQTTPTPPKLTPLNLLNWSVNPHHRRTSRLFETCAYRNEPSPATLTPVFLPANQCRLDDRRTPVLPTSG